MRTFPPSGKLFCNSRRRVSLAERLPVNSLFFQKHLAPVALARHGAGQLAGHTGCVQPLARCLCISAGLVQPKESRTGPGQRGVEGCLRCTGTRKDALDFCKGRMLGERRRVQSRSESSSISRCGQARTLEVRPGSLPRKEHRRSLLPADLLKSTPDWGSPSRRRWHRRGSTHLAQLQLI